MYLIKFKSEAFKRFKEFRSKVENETDKSIKIFQLNRGGEYLSHVFIDYLKENGILP